MVASLDNLSNAADHRNYTVEKLVISNKTLTDPIASLQAQNLKLIKLVTKLTSGTHAVANPSTSDKPPWGKTGYCLSHGYKVRTGHNSEIFNTRNPGHETTAKRGDTKGGAIWNEQRVPKSLRVSPAGNGIKLETNNLVNNLISNPGCTKPNNIYTTTLIDSEDNVTLLDDLAPENTADIQLDNNIIMQPKGSKMKTREKLQLLLNKIPEPGREEHQ